MTQPAATFAVIGGSGFYEIEGLSGVETISVDTPFGPPSDRIVLGTLDGVRMAFLPRHGVGHRILPGEIPQQANIWALASLGVEYIASVSAVGSLREQIVPLHMVVPDQLIDRTRGDRRSTFFGRGIVAHVGLDEPFCPALGAALRGAARAEGATAHDGGTMVVIEGPAFSTRAESELYRALGRRHHRHDSAARGQARPRSRHLLRRARLRHRLRHVARWPRQRLRRDGPQEPQHERRHRASHRRGHRPRAPRPVVRLRRSPRQRHHHPHAPRARRRPPRFSADTNRAARGAVVAGGQGGAA